MKRLAILILIIGLWCHVGGQTLEDYSGQTAAQLSAMQDRVTVPNTSYWNTHAYLQLQTLIARVLTLSDSSGVFTPIDSTISWAKLMTAVQDSIQKTNRIGTNGVLWAMLAAAVQDSIQLQDRISANAITIAKIDTGAAGWIDVRKFGAVGNGTTDDTHAITAALDYANALGGGTVLFPTGTYITTTDTIHSNTRLIGGPGAVIKLKNAADVHILFADGADNIILDGLEIDGNISHQTTYGLLQAATRFDNTTRLIVRNCYLHDLANIGVYSSGAATGAVIRDNRFENHKGAITLYTSDSLLITGNVITNKGYARDINPNGISLVNTSYSTISNNRIVMDYNVGETNAAFAIELLSGGVYAQVNNIVTGNNINCGRAQQHNDGISLAWSDRSIISNNLIYNAKGGLGAIEVEGSNYCLVTHNQIDSFVVGVSINLASFGANVSSNQFSNTMFAPPWGFGISVGGSGSDSSTNRYHLFNGNTFHKVHNPFRFNAYGGWSSIVNNQADSCDHFIYMDHASYGPMNFMKISNNRAINSTRFFSLNANDADTLKGWRVSDNESLFQTGSNIMSVWLDYYAHGNSGLDLADTP